QRIKTEEILPTEQESSVRNGKRNGRGKVASSVADNCFSDFHVKISVLSLIKDADTKNHRSESILLKGTFDLLNDSVAKACKQ
uniref:Uncharacterized protein n=1 Tax=Falco tinnunculus TaxID=100819 RepID=A0A8C4UWH1_FALTI